MRLSGWIFMALAWACILSLMTFCFRRIFKKGLDSDESEDLKDKNKRRHIK